MTNIGYSVVALLMAISITATSSRSFAQESQALSTISASTLKLLRAELDGVRWVREQGTPGAVGSGVIALVSIPTALYASAFAMGFGSIYVKAVVGGNVYPDEHLRLWNGSNVMFSSVKRAFPGLEGLAYATNVLKRLALYSPNLLATVLNGGIAVVAGTATVSVLLPEAIYQDFMKHLDETIANLESAEDLNGLGK